MQSGKSWVVDLDISAFFDEVDHDILMHRVGQIDRDKRTLRLIGRYLRAPQQDGIAEGKRTRGTPQGGPLSPVLANIYLDALDKELERRKVSFCRYADDCAPRRREGGEILLSSQAAQEMREVPSVSAYRRRHQTTHCCCV